MGKSNVYAHNGGKFDYKHFFEQAQNDVDFREEYPITDLLDGNKRARIGPLGGVTG